MCSFWDGFLTECFELFFICVAVVEDVAAEGLLGSMIDFLLEEQ